MKIKELMEQVEIKESVKTEVFQNLVASMEPSVAISFMTNYVNDMCITLSGIAAIAKKTSQATLNMIKCNKGGFPKAYNFNGTNFYIKRDVIDWLISNNKIPRNQNDHVQQEFLYGNQKSICFLGSSGNGKSTLCASAAEPSVVPFLKKILTAGKAMGTKNLMKLHFKKNSVNYVVFHYGESFNDSIPIKIVAENVDRIKEELKKCKKKAEDYRENKETDNLIGTYVEFVLEPNKLVSKLMSDCNIDILTLVDTPGLDRDYSGDSVAMADIIVMVLGDRDDVDSITEKIKTNIIPETGSIPYIYLYNNRFAFDYKNCDDVYEASLKDAMDELGDYSDSLKNLQEELVIGSTLSACRPLDSLLCVPNFSREVGLIEDFFFHKFCEKIKEALCNSSYFMELNSFGGKTLSHDFIKLLNKHIQEFAKTLPKDGSYDIYSFIKEKHGRTKSLDNDRIEYYFGQTLRSLKNYFYETFSKYKATECDDKMASMIRMVYVTINEGLLNKVRYGYGSHPWEDTNSPTQMICEEVLSKELISNAKGRTYCQILADNLIQSNFWSYVYVSDTDWNKAKLKISNDYDFPSFKTNDFMSYMKVCHFLPSILVQSVLAFYKVNPSSWNKVNSTDVMEDVMKDVKF